MKVAADLLTEREKAILIACVMFTNANLDDVNELGGKGFTDEEMSSLFLKLNSLGLIL